jgi:hypothetical protein
LSFPPLPCEGRKKYSQYQVCTSKSASPEADWQGWLYGMTWLLFEKNYLIEIPLALECEWGEVDPDFQKLLQSRSHHRIMIFQDKNISEILEIIIWFKESIIKYKNTCIDDRYLFAGYNIQEKRFEFELFSPRLMPIG